jgi:uncharacterized protein (DUF1697 family)
MHSAVALLRGINVGGHRRVPMADLRELAGEIGLVNARTYVASGNLVFESTIAMAQVEPLLERAIERRFGFAVDVVVRDATQWGSLVVANPFLKAAEAEPKSVWLFLSKQPPQDSAADELRRAGQGIEIEQAGGGIWVHWTAGVSMSVLKIAWDRLIGSPATSRNWRTVLTIQEMLEGG